MAERTSTRMTAVEFLNQPESNLIHELLDGEAIMSPAPEPAHQKVSRAIFRFLLSLTLTSKLFHPFLLFFSPRYRASIGGAGDGEGTGVRFRKLCKDQ